MELMEPIEPMEPMEPTAQMVLTVREVSLVEAAIPVGALILYRDGIVGRWNPLGSPGPVPICRKVPRLNWVAGMRGFASFCSQSELLSNLYFAVDPAPAMPHAPVGNALAFQSGRRSDRPGRTRGGLAGVRDN